ncbi:MAG: hypothetical protein K9I34_03580 [Bacteroidales bacterium]|nr:hypothetical protein [Bacteroidales bacterium]
MEQRKTDHITLAFESATQQALNDPRFYYEPLLSGHPGKTWQAFNFLGKTMRYPLWVSSMTGGTKEAGTINRNLALACKEFGLGMGLGSCRIILENDTYLDDFKVRKFLGDEQPLFANLGIAQVEELLFSNQLHKIDNLLDKLEADGLIIHINPLQEFFQPEGDKITRPPLETISKLLDRTDHRIVVKEVGQGMGPESIRQLFELPISGFEFAAFGGTNFSRLEMMRAGNQPLSELAPMALTGHSAAEMIGFIQDLQLQFPSRKIPQLIISGGITNFLDGYYLLNQVSNPAVYGQAAAFLKHARGSYEDLQQFVESQLKGLELAKAYLRIRKSE